MKYEYADDNPYGVKKELLNRILFDRLIVIMKLPPNILKVVLLIAFVPYAYSN